MKDADLLQCGSQQSAQPALQTEGCTLTEDNTECCCTWQAKSVDAWNTLLQNLHNKDCMLQDIAIELVYLVLQDHNL